MFVVLNGGNGSPVDHRGTGSRFAVGAEGGDDRGVEDQRQAPVERQIFGDDLDLLLVSGVYAWEPHVAEFLVQQIKDEAYVG